MHLIHWECLSNGAKAARVCAQRYPKRKNHPNPRAFIHLHWQLMETGHLVPQLGREHGLPKEQNRQEHWNEDDVSDYVYQNPATSVRKTSRELDISRFTVQRIIKGEKLHQYHNMKVQKFEPGV